jgi:hypothetical protein
LPRARGRASPISLLHAALTDGLDQQVLPDAGFPPRPFEETVRDTLAWFAEAGMLEEPFAAPEASPAS